MDRETKRLIEEYRRNEAGPLENNVIDEFVGGELDRQDFLRRATMFGLGAGTIGAFLRFMGEPDLAFGAPLEAVQAGGIIRVGIPVFGASLEPYLLNEGPSLAFAGIPGEYLTFTTLKGTSRARARDELAAECGRDGVDVPDPQGRQVPQRQDADRRRTSWRV